MRFTRSLMLVLAMATTFPAAGCALEPGGVPAATATEPGVDSIAYGTPSDNTTGTIATSSRYVGRGLFTDYFAPTPQVLITTAPTSAPQSPPPPPPSQPSHSSFFGGPRPAPAALADAAPASPPQAHSSFFGGPGPAPTATVDAAPVAPPQAHTSHFGGPGPTVPEATPPVVYTPPSSGSYTLDSGDRLRIVVFGQDGLSNAYVVDASGNIAMPLIGTIRARGLTTEELTRRVAAKLKEGFVRDPQVAVEIEAYRPFFILGEVTAPGQYPFIANMTVETAVAIAGGFGPRAYRQTVTLSRIVNGQRVRMTVPITDAVRPGDTLNIEERWF